MLDLSFVANASINASRFVLIVADGSPGLANSQRVNQAGANDRTIGVGPEYSIAAGENCPVRVAGKKKLTLGGTVVAGDRLKSDASGQGVAIATGSTTIQNVGAFATQPGVSGDVVDVLVENYAVLPGDYLS